MVAQCLLDAGKKRVGYAGFAEVQDRIKPLRERP